MRLKPGIPSAFFDEILCRDAWGDHRQDDGASRALAADLQARNYRGTATIASCLYSEGVN